jgi:D-alanyl-D-alanine carboxypeptidase
MIGKALSITFYGAQMKCLICDAYFKNMKLNQRTRIKKFIPLFIVAFICIGFLAHSFFSKDRNETSSKRLQQGVELAWPAVGQAAIGSVEDGVLASSSDNERLRPIASMAKVITALAIMNLISLFNL